MLKSSQSVCWADRKVVSWKIRKAEWRISNRTTLLATLTVAACVSSAPSPSPDEDYSPHDDYQEHDYSYLAADYDHQPHYIPVILPHAPIIVPEHSGKSLDNGYPTKSYNYGYPSKSLELPHVPVVLPHVSAPYDGAEYANYAPKHDHEHYSYPKYSFNYGVHDPHTGDIKQQWEERDGDKVKGMYSLVEPDGTIRVVEYTADDHNGFNAIVKKIGVAHHPSPVHHAPLASYPSKSIDHPYNNYAYPTKSLDYLPSKSTDYYVPSKSIDYK